MKELVTVDWLKEKLNNQDLILLDASLQSTAEGKSSHNASKTINGARYFDLKGKFTDTESQFPNTIPFPDKFEAECQLLGINRTSKIVVFDSMGVYSSPRVWWLFKTMGHEEVYVLNGGLPEWIRNGYKTVERSTQRYKRGNFIADYHTGYVKNYQDILENLDTGSFQVIDARSAGRFEGTESEPRKHLQSGHIPNSINIPHREVTKNGKFRSVKELKNLFENRCPSEKQLVFSCGSGLTACIVMLACLMTYGEDMYIYDGSWSEWAELQGLTVDD